MQDSCVTEIHKNKTVRESMEPSRIHVSTKPQHVTTTSSDDKQTDSAITTPFVSGRQDSDLSITEIIESIEEIACPNECFDRGTCQKGNIETNFVMKNKRSWSYLLSTSFGLSNMYLSTQSNLAVFHSIVCTAAAQKVFVLGFLWGKSI